MKYIGKRKFEARNQFFFGKLVEFLRFHIPASSSLSRLQSCKPVANLAICFRLYSGNNDYIII